MQHQQLKSRNGVIMVILAHGDKVTRIVAQCSNYGLMRQGQSTNYTIEEDLQICWSYNSK
jgi:uncharacterized Rossmann fold enzyme